MDSLNNEGLLYAQWFSLNGSVPIGYKAGMGSIRKVDMGSRVVARRTDVNASADALFAIVSDPRRHGELDGSGTVKDTVKGPERLEQGAKFSVGMKQYGVPYRITSTVTDFRDDDGSKVIEWQGVRGDAARCDNSHRSLPLRHREVAEGARALQSAATEREGNQQHSRTARPEVRLSRRARNLIRRLWDVRR